MKQEKNYIIDPLNMIVKAFDKMNNWGKVLVLIVIFLIVLSLLKPFRTSKEGFEQNEQFVFKSGPEVYDGFYADIYDQLVFNNLKD